MLKQNLLKQMKFRILLLFFLSAVTGFAQELLTLPSAIEAGLKNNFSIILQTNNAEVLKNNNTAGNAGMLPSLGLTTTQNNTIYTTHQEAFSGAVKDVSNAVNTSLNAGLQLNWTLFDGLNMFVNRQTLDMMQQLGENQSRVAVEEVVSQIAQQYFNIIQLKKVVEVSRDAVSLSVQRKKIAEAQIKLGSGSLQQLLQSTVDLNADSTQLLLQITVLQNAKTDMNYLLARDAATPFDISDTIRLMQLSGYGEFVDKAMQQNTDLLAAKMDQRLSELNVKSVQSGRYPQLNLLSGYNFILQKSQTGFAQFNRSFGPYIGFTASYNLFDGSNTSREIRNARIMLNSSEITVEQTSLDVRTGIMKLYNSYQTSLELIKLETRNIEAAQQNVDMAFAKYKLGTITDIELREMQKKLLDARYTLLQSQFDAKKAEIELLQLSGDLIGLFNPKN
jgi:outer membrane protein TolC